MGKAEKQTTEQSALAAGAAGIRELRTVLARVVQERERIRALAAAAQEHHGTIDALKYERAEVLATAMIDGDEPDVHNLDERIAEAERAAAKALSEGTVAADALRVLDARRTALKGRLAQAQAEQLDLARRDLLQQRELAMQAYNEAIDSVCRPLQRLLAIERTMSTIIEREYGRRSSGHAGVVNNLIEELQSKGLRRVHERDHTPWQPAWLAWPQVTAECLPFQAEYLTRSALD